MKRTPPHARAVLLALRFSDTDSTALAALDAAEWRAALDFADRAQLTLPLARFGLPVSVRERVAKNLADNAERFERTKTAYNEAARALEAAGVETLVLKGFAHAPWFVPDPRLRPQYDIDLLCAPEATERAYEALLNLGYEPIGDAGGDPSDHLPTLIRKTGWTFNGNLYDPEIPLSMELHYRLWDPSTERLPLDGLEKFWERRIERSLDDLHFITLDPADALAYACMHLLRHLLRGDVRLGHAYELAWFLESNADNEEFWERWRGLHDGPLRQIQTLCFRLAALWFGCRVPCEIETLPEPVERWFARYGWSPIESLFHPNKDELWLHLSLLTEPRDRQAVFLRRLFPLRVPGPVHAVHIPDGQVTWGLRVERKWRYLAFVSRRILHHARSLAPALTGAARWWSDENEFTPQFWRYFVVDAFFDFGAFIYFSLYSLYLLRLGYNEAFIGQVAFASTAGTFAGTIPAGFLLRRFGVRHTLISFFIAAFLLFSAGALVTGRVPLLTLALLRGMAMSVWFVALSPVIAQLTNRRNRSSAFSFVFSSDIAMGVLVGSAFSLPGWLTRTSAMTEVHAWQTVLLLGSFVSVLAVIPALRLRLQTPPPSGARVYPRSPFLYRFLGVMALWSLAAGAFNPQSNAYFDRYIHVPASQIGLAFSLSQFFQVVAILCAPPVFRRLGLIRGVAGTQLATAAALVCLAVVHAPPAAIAAYVAYMAFQYMNSPGSYTLLMDSVRPQERTGASELNFLVLLPAQAAAAWAGGVSVVKFGYPVMLMVSAALAVLAALLFRTLKPPAQPLQ